VRVLAVDFGSKRIGLAAGDTGAEIASPRAALPSVEGLSRNAEAIVAAAQEEEAALVVVGIPVNDSGSDAMERVCRKLAQHIRDLGLEVEEVDESLSSVQAEERLRAHDWTAAQRDRHLDSEAACLILERYFQSHGRA
jgi:putative holliday junction resolvase